MEKISVKELTFLSKEDLLGKTIVFPTDTVYGIGCLYDDRIGAEKIYRIKKRSRNKPLPVLCSSLEQVMSLAVIDDAIRPYTAYWPGPLTVILNKKNEKGTVAVRIPGSETALAVLKAIGPLLVTSVNESGEKEINDPEEIEKRFGSDIDYFVTGKEKFSGTPSAIVAFEGEDLKIIRRGTLKLQ